MAYLLIGQEDSKRTLFFRQAAADLGVELDFLPLPEADLSPAVLRKLAGAVIKIDPPKYDTGDFEQLPRLIRQYRGVLEQMASVPGAVFLNSPQGILLTLDKLRCKQVLMAQQLAVTPLCDFSERSFQALRHYLRTNHLSGVFVKPRYGSGAAGVMAYRWQNEREVLYSSAVCGREGVYNTKQMQRYTDPQMITALGDGILAQGAIVERWLPKACHEGKSYDLRVVCQFGKVAFVTARLADSPITNLHLNNGALAWQSLGLAAEVWQAVESLCLEAMALLPGLQYAGLDVLLSGQKQKPYIIEINGQGDLLYQDIYAGNVIYRQQIERMVALREQL